MKCRLCGEERNIFKLGCCKSCYRYNVVKRYKLKEDVNFRVDSQEAMIEEFLSNQNVSKQYLADKYCITLRNVYYAIKQYCDEYYVRRDNKQEIN